MDAGHEVLVVQPGPLGAAPPAGLEVIETPVRHGASLAFAKVLSGSPLRTARVSVTGRNVAARAIRSFEPDLAVISDLLSWPVAGPLLPDVAWIFDSHNVESDLFAQMAGTASGLFDRVTLAVDRRRVARQEREVVGAADAVLAVSQEDADALQRLGQPRRDPVVVPSSVPDPGIAREFVADPTVLFVGTLDFPPNVEAVTELINGVMPRVRDHVPDALLRVVGRKPTAAVRSLLAGASWVDFAEDAPNVDVHYRQARCVILPIRSGGGSRLKVYEALAHGVPVVGTDRAFAGIPLEANAVVRAETVHDLVEGAVRLLTDDSFARDAGAAARAEFVDRLSWQHAGAPLLDLIEQLTARA